MGIACFEKKKKYVCCKTCSSSNCFYELVGKFSAAGCDSELVGVYRALVDSRGVNVSCVRGKSSPTRTSSTPTASPPPSTSPGTRLPTLGHTEANFELICCESPCRTLCPRLVDVENIPSL